MAVKIKKSQCRKQCARKRKFEDYKNCLEATKFENRINHLKEKFNTEILKENHKDFVKKIS